MLVSQTSPKTGRTRVRRVHRTEEDVRKHEEGMKARTLWLSVIKTALDDVDFDKPWELTHYEAMRWFEGAGKDFYRVCALAGIHPDKVLARYRQIKGTARAETERKGRK